MKAVVASAVLLLGLSLSVAGCGGSARGGDTLGGAARGGDGPDDSAAASRLPGPPAAPAMRLTLLAVDYSKSTEGIRTQLLTTAFNIGTAFNTGRDTMIVYRFGHTIQEVYSGLPDDEDAFALILAQYMKGSDPVLGTNYPLMIEALADTAANAPESQIRIIIVGDGENDFAANPSVEHYYRDAAVRLSQNLRVKWVRFWGVDVGTREEIRSVFKPLGQRLQILSMDQNPLAP